MAAHEESLGLRRRIAERWGETPDAVRDLSLSLNKIGDIRRLEGDLDQARTAFAEAVLDTGDRQTVFVDLGNGYLQPRQVVAGERFGDRVTITRGLAAGERVVSSGTFLIDSESQLKAATNGMGAPQPPANPHAGHGRD